jgi:hypothetical protein
MTFPIEIVLKGRDFAVTESIEVAEASSDTWTDEGVRAMLIGILRAIARAEDPAAAREVVLRGFSWIVEPVEAVSNQVVIAIEIPMGAAVAGPFAIEQTELDARISRVLRAERKDPMSTVH